MKRTSHPSTIRTILPALLGLLLLSSLPAAAQGSLAFAKITSQGQALDGFRQLESIGGVDLTGYIQLKSFEYEVLKPEAGRGAEGLQVGPVKITKYVDAATPLLTQALYQNTDVTMEILLFGIDPNSGASIHLATWTLTGARVVSDRVWLPQQGATAIPQPCQEIQLTYGQLQITHEASSQTFELAAPQP